ncbi:MAG: 50S ribosomal protein L10 [Candidatus Paceibacterota bacterium]
MPLTKQKKESVVKDIEEKLAKQKSIVFMDFKGINVKDLTEVRNKLKSEGSEMKIAKKSLLGIALKNQKIEADVSKLEGEIALVFGYEDEVAPSKIIYQFTKTNKKARLVGGLVGENFYGPTEIIKFAQLPGREQLLAMLVGTINAPISGFVSALHGNLRNLVCALSAIEKKKS